MNFNKNVYSRIYLTNFLPIIVTNTLKKGKKEKSFVKVNKVLQRIKKIAILNDSFLMNKRLFLNKIFYFGLEKNKSLKKKDLIQNQNFYFNFFKRTRENSDFLLKVRIFFFISNLYSNDFFQFERYNNRILADIFHKKTKLLIKRKKLKLLVKKKYLDFFFSFSKSGLNIMIKRFTNNLMFNNLIINRFYDLKFLINNLLKKIFLLKFFVFKKRIINLTKFNFKIFLKKNLFNLNFLSQFIIKRKKALKQIKKNYKKFPTYYFKRFYFLNKKTKLLRKQHEDLNKKYFLFKKINKKMTRFEFKKRKYLYDRLKKIYKKSRAAFFKYKRRIFFKKKKEIKKKKYITKNSSNNFNFGNIFGLKLFVIKKPLVEKKKKIKRKFFFKYSSFPVLFSPIKFLNVVLSKYRLYFTFKEKRLWGKNQLIPNILDLKRDVRITARNFKKSLQDIKFQNLNFQISFFESLLYAGSKKGFLLKIKQQAYVFMLKNAIFLQFMLRRRKKSSRRKRRKKIDRK